MASFVEPAARQCSRRGSGPQADNRRPCASYRATNLCDIDLTPTPPRTAPAAPEPVRPRRIHYHLIRPPSHSFHNMPPARNQPDPAPPAADTVILTDEATNYSEPRTTALTVILTELKATEGSRVRDDRGPEILHD